MTRRFIVLLAAMYLGAFSAWAQQSSTGSAAPPAQQSMPGMDMPGHDMSNMKGMAIPSDNDPAGAVAMHSMEGHMDMGPHMKLTALRASKPDDAERAQKVVEAARKASEKYLDYHVALADGFKIFLPNIPQKMYHFTNYSYGMEAAFGFNPEHPTSLLYEKHGEDYKLIGVMYTAPKRFTEDDLDQRIPLSIAQWHEHVNFCTAPAGRKMEYFGPHPLFGLKGSITTQEACDKEGGTFHPVIFNWMVHVYPFEKDQANIWSVERQHGDAGLTRFDSQNLAAANYVDNFPIVQRVCFCSQLRNIERLFGSGQVPHHQGLVNSFSYSNGQPCVPFEWQ